MSSENVQSAVRMLEIWVWPTSPLITEPKIVNGTELGEPLMAACRIAGCRALALEGTLELTPPLYRRGI